MDVNQYMNTVWMGNSVRAWLIALAVLAVGVAILMALKALVVGRFIKFASRTTNEVDDLLVELLRRTRLWVLVLLAIAVVAFLMLELPYAIRTGVKFVA